MSPTPRDVAPDGLDDIFWEACTRGEFLVHRCERCQRSYWPASTCVDHGSASMRWVPASGRARVHTYTIVHHAYIPSFADRVPYVLAVVRLDEGPFFHTNIVGCDPADVTVDMRVEVVFERRDDGVVLPMFSPTTDPTPEDAP